MPEEQTVNNVDHKSKCDESKRSGCEFGDSVRGMANVRGLSFEEGSKRREKVNVIKMRKIPSDIPKTCGI